MAHSDPLVAAIQDKIEKNEAALKPLLEERRYLDARLKEAMARYATTPPVALHVVRPVVVTLPQGKPAAPLPVTTTSRATFSATPGGPQETLLTLLVKHDGIKSDALYDLAIPVVRGAAKNPRRSLAETLRQLIAKGRISRDKSGGLHLIP